MSAIRIRISNVCLCLSVFLMSQVLTQIVGVEIASAFFGWGKPANSSSKPTPKPAPRVKKPTIKAPPVRAKSPVIIEEEQPDPGVEHSKYASLVFVERRLAPFSDPCTKLNDSFVLVHLENQTLFLCQSGRMVGSFPVSVGPGGTGKKREGDNKTPVGIYDLRVGNSSNYGEVLRVGYPNAEQQANGYIDESGQQRRYTGSNILVHGPAINMQLDLADLRQFLISNAGRANGRKIFELAVERMKTEGIASINWTAGCLAVGSREDLRELVRFAKDAEPRQIKLVVVANRNEVIDWSAAASRVAPAAPVEASKPESKSSGWSTGGIRWSPVPPKSEESAKPDSQEPRWQHFNDRN